ncbi:hypothetical protein AYO44_13115 [Planctomycetaceae bacterium SCGC AG-212-F19]|nr:hypothetical protein AYO44_13115 [Planctomycetaceae bacterium SCGC AG-212-F19]
MNWSDIPWHPSPQTLRRFAGLWLIVFAAIAGWNGLVHAHMGIGITAAVLAATIGPLGLVWPRAVRPIFVGWLVLAFPIGWLMSRLLLAGLFFGLFTPIGLFFRLIGRDALRCRRLDTGSFWLAKESTDDGQRYLCQY